MTMILMTTYFFFKKKKKRNKINIETNRLPNGKNMSHLLNLFTTHSIVH